MHTFYYYLPALYSRDPFNLENEHSAAKEDPWTKEIQSIDLTEVY